jgi:hypothetical protein
MQGTFERVTERHGGKATPVKHFYRRQYQIAGGEWRTIYYARFKDWKGKRRTFSLGSALGPARDGLALYEARNIRREDFDADKVKGMTLADWLKRYLDLVKGTASYKPKEWRIVATTIYRRSTVAARILLQRPTPSPAAISPTK